MPDEARNLFIPLIDDVARRQVKNVWLIVLGFNMAISPSLGGWVLHEELSLLSHPDVDRYLRDIMQQRGAASRDRTTLLAKIFDGLTPPVGGDQLMKMAQRLAEQLEAF